jgi:AraC-like DNA-binding protein
VIATAKLHATNFVAGEYLTCLRDFALSKKLPVINLLKGTQQDVNFLLNPPDKIDELTMLTISSNLFNLMPNPILASIEFGKSMAMSSHGVLGLAIQGCQTLEEAALLVKSYAQTRASAQTIDIINGEHHCYLRLSDDRHELIGKNVLDLLYYTHLSTLINIEGLVRKLLEHHELKGLCIIGLNNAQTSNFPFEHLPKDLKIEFNSQHYQLGFPNSWLKLGLNQGDLELAKIAESECLLTLKQLSPEDLIQQVYKVLDTASSSNINLQSMAASLLMSPSTLQRRLKELNTTYKKIKARVRINQAKALLKHTNKTIDAIAYTLDYSDASNFTKSFKGHTGLTPKSYRLSLSNEPDGL